MNLEFKGKFWKMIIYLCDIWFLQLFNTFSNFIKTRLVFLEKCQIIALQQNMKNTVFRAMVNSCLTVACTVSSVSRSTAISNKWDLFQNIKCQTSSTLNLSEPSLQKYKKWFQEYWYILSRYCYLISCCLRPSVDFRRSLVWFKILLHCSSDTTPYRVHSQHGPRCVSQGRYI